MSGAQGNALDWALALARAPSERHALRLRALPEEIDTLIQIAGGGAADALARAAARTGESPKAIVEASRFYLREVLFFPEADAYRLLGVSSDADQGLIRSHHRLLQQWLHPDRSSEEDALFAARVNAAWDQVRQPDRRAAYDRSLPPPRAQAAGDDAAYPLRPWIPVAVPEVRVLPAQERWRQRAPLLVLLAACFGLGVITVRHQQRLDEAGGVPLAGKLDDATPLLRLPKRMASPEPAVEARRHQPAPSTAAIGKQAPDASPGDLARDDPFQAFTVEDDPDFAIPPEAVDVQAPAAAPVPSPPRRSLEAASQARIATAEAEVPPARPAPPPASDPIGAQPPPAAATAVSPQPRASEERVAATATPPVPPVASPPPALVPDPQRVLGAQQVGERLLSYLLASGRTMPAIWNSVSAERAAAQIRGNIARGQGPRFETPTWRITNTDAALQVALNFRDGREGRLRGRLKWREQRWLVSDLSMEQDW